MTPATKKRKPRKQRKTKKPRKQTLQEVYYQLPIHKQFQDPQLFEPVAENVGQFMAAREVLKIQAEERGWNGHKDHTPAEVGVKLAIYDVLKTRILNITSEWSAKHPLKKQLKTNMKLAGDFLSAGDVERALNVLYGVIKGLNPYSDVCRRQGFVLQTA